MATNGESRTQSHAQRAYSFSQRHLNRVISPERRQKSYDATAQFAIKRPVLFAFLVSQLFFSALPFGLFISFCLSTVAFAIISAFAFCFFWIGIALLVLIPILFITISIAIFVWLWAVATFFIGQRVYRMLPASLQGDMHKRKPNGEQVIFQKTQKNGVGMNHDGVKKEAIEIKE